MALLSTWGHFGTRPTPLPLQHVKGESVPLFSAKPLNFVCKFRVGFVVVLASPAEMYGGQVVMKGPFCPPNQPPPGTNQPLLCACSQKVPMGLARRRGRDLMTGLRNFASTFSHPQPSFCSPFYFNECASETHLATAELTSLSQDMAWNEYSPSWNCQFLDTSPPPGLRSHFLEHDPPSFKVLLRIRRTPSFSPPPPRKFRWFYWQFPLLSPLPLGGGFLPANEPPCS
jgi:hypothetical protein